MAVIILERSRKITKRLSLGWAYVGHLEIYAGCSNPEIIFLLGHGNRNYIILQNFCDKVVAATSIKEGPYAFGIDWSPQ